MGQMREYQGYQYEQQPDGSWRRVGPAQGQQQMPVDPAYPYQGQQAQAQVGQTQAGTRNTNANATVTEATTPSTIVTANLPEGMMWVDPNDPSKGYTAIPRIGPAPANVSETQRSEAIQAYSDAAALENLIAQLRESFAAGPGSTSGLSSIQDYLPLSRNTVFNDIAQQARGYVKRALGFTGGEGNTVAESSALYDPYLPSASDTDARILNKIEALQRLANDSRARSMQVLGGIPDQNGNIQPVPAGAIGGLGGSGGTGGPGPSAMDQTVIAAPATQMQASGERGTYGVPLPTEMQQRYRDWVLANGATMTPQSYSDFRNALNREFSGAIRERDSTRAGPGGFPENVPGAPIQFQQQDYTAEGQRIIDALKQGGGALNLTIPPVEVPLTESQAATDRAARNPAMATLAGVANMGSFGGVEGLLGDQYNAMRDVNGDYMLAGEAVGALGPTSAISFLGRNTVGRFAPRLLNGGQMANLARGMAADATFSGIYGYNTGQDPLTSAAIGGLASGVGGGLAKTVGGVAGGVAASAPVQRLYDLGVRPTIGQIARGSANGGRSIIADLEDNLANSGWMGSFVNNARNRTLEQANLAGYNIGARGAGNVTETGLPGVTQLQDISRQAYSDALSPVNVPYGAPEVQQAVLGARQNFGQIDARRGVDDLGLFMDREINPLLGNGGAMNGQNLQDLMIANREASRRFDRASATSPSARYAAGAVDDFNDNLQSAVQVYAPDAIPALQEANRIYRNFDILDNAAGAAANDGGLWTGAQLNQAIKASATRNATSSRGRGLAARSNSDLYQLQQDMSEVLPSRIPPTGVNAAPLLALAGIGAAGTGYATDNNYLAPAALLSLAALPYTKGGQRAVASLALAPRNPTVRQFSDVMLRRSGLFGSAAVPAILPRN